MWAEIGEDKISERSNVKLLGVTIDNRINFSSHIASIYLKQIYLYRLPLYAL